MLTLTIAARETFDDATSTFGEEGGITIELEHSLVSLSKWESKFQKPFLSQDEKTADETLAYIECMIVTKNYPRDILRQLSQADYNKINEYINSKQTATWFNEDPNQKPSRETLTSELIYYWMFSAQIPIECESWNLNRLFTLIKVFNVKNSKPKNMSRAEAAQQRRALNEQRKQQLNTRG